MLLGLYLMQDVQTAAKKVAGAGLPGRMACSWHDTPQGEPGAAGRPWLCHTISLQPSSCVCSLAERNFPCFHRREVSGEQLLMAQGWPALVPTMKRQGPPHSFMNPHIHLPKAQFAYTGAARTLSTLGFVPVYYYFKDYNTYFCQTRKPISTRSLYLQKAYIHKEHIRNYIPAVKIPQMNKQNTYAHTKKYL